jgi:hypothetical protein
MNNMTNELNNILDTNPALAAYILEESAMNTYHIMVNGQQDIITGCYGLNDLRITLNSMGIYDYEVTSTIVEVV